MGKFTKGHAKVGGRRKGALNHNTMRERRLVADKDDRKIIDGVIEASKAGDASARVVYFRYVRPASPRAGTFLKPIDYKVPTTVEEAHAAILALGGRLAKGEISLEAHDALVGGLRAFLAAKAAEQERRPSELEAELAIKDQT
jgi:hypothetical protein